ncbi:MAG: hypothetical protein AVDCRST_MAG33-166, partial [uncultured Thermomicrobiales bacterium]
GTTPAAGGRPPPVGLPCRYDRRSTQLLRHRWTEREEPRSAPGCRFRTV